MSERGGVSCGHHPGCRGFHTMRHWITSFLLGCKRKVRSRPDSRKTKIRVSQKFEGTRHWPVAQVPHAMAQGTARIGATGPRRPGRWVGALAGRSASASGRRFPEARASDSKVGLDERGAPPPTIVHLRWPADFAGCFRPGAAQRQRPTAERATSPQARLSPHRSALRRSRAFLGQAEAP